MGKKACLLISQLPTQKVFVLKWSNEKNTSSDSQISTHKVFILEQSNETISPLTTSLFSNGLMKKGCLLIHNSPLAKVFILGWSNEKRMSSDNSPLIMSLFSNDLIKKMDVLILIHNSPLTKSLPADSLMTKACLLIHNSSLAKSLSLNGLIPGACVCACI